LAKVNIAQISDSADNIMLCNTKISDFRATLSKQVSFDHAKNILNISPEIAEHLLLQNQDEVRFLVL
jgi:arginine/ornithine N-succinyltransferase beta subunit